MSAVPATMAEAVNTLLRAAGTEQARLDVGPFAAGSVPEAVVAAQHVLQLLDLHEQAEEELTDALVAAQDRLLALYDLTRVQAESRDHAEAHKRTAAAVLTSTECDSGVLAGGGLLYRAGDEAHFPILTRIAEEAVARGLTEPAVWPDAPTPTMVAPVPVSTSPALAIAITRTRGPAFDTGDVKLVAAVAAVIGGLVNLTRLHQSEVERAQLEQEHQMASALAQAVLSTEPPQVPGAEVYAECVPANLAGGDFFTFAPRDGALWFAVGDVAGKGLPAAMIMTRAVTAIRNACVAGRSDDPADVVNQVNEELFGYLVDAGRFITMAVGRYLPGSGHVDVCNAGHSPLARADRSGVTVIPPATLPIGALSTVDARSLRLPFDEGDLLVLGSDGLAEQQDPRGRLFGYERFLTAVGRAHEALSYGRRHDDVPAQVARRLFDEVAQHAADTQPDDDCTLVVLRAAEVAR
ncbi:PP2C family protein-serine/threonine phosphatase [Actinoplanes sp. NPDC049548]|uniref:PP2C family protein-serine/threonine phosphatase n=1 Tax=Actinoplanes sp. NPDC049548 TaxID=3155152 RepID=UPI0034451B83